MEKAKAFLKEFFAQWKQVVFQPQAYFENMEVNGFGKPAYFLITCLALSWAFNGVLKIFLALTTDFLISYVVKGLIFSAFISVAAIAVLLITIPIQYFTGKQLGSTADFERCFWVGSFACAPLLLSFIPYAGILTAVYGLALLFVGIKINHQLPLPKTILVFLSVFLTLVVVGLLRYYVSG